MIVWGNYMLASERIIIAFDVENKCEALQLAEKLGDKARFVKIGSQLYTREGPSIVNELKSMGKRIFLDLKYHDIPNTVAKSAEAAVALGVDIFNIHVSGGMAMARACVESVNKASEKYGVKRPVVLGVTILTSFDENEIKNVWGFDCSITEQVERMALLAKESGLDGVVASPREIGMIREACGDDFIILTPGIRPQWASKDDQKRIMTPAEAIKTGSDYIVIGRPVTKAEKPQEAFSRILDEIE